MTLVLYRVDDRLIHGQVVVGWGQPLNIDFIVLVDDEVARSEWEQELYRMGVPPNMDVYFVSTDEAARALERYRADSRRGILLTGDIETMRRLAERAEVTSINVGGVHHRAGRTQRLRYVFLSPEEEQALRQLAQRGIDISAQDVPNARPVELEDLLNGADR